MLKFYKVLAKNQASRERLFGGILICNETEAVAVAAAVAVVAPVAVRAMGVTGVDGKLHRPNIGKGGQSHAIRIGRTAAVPT